jgi:hypothetical protein
MKSQNLNTNLGLYNMVLAMSEGSINFLLQGLMEEEIIKDTWSVRVIYDDDDNMDVIIDESKEEYEENIKPGMEGFFSELDFMKIEIEKNGDFALLFCLPFTTGQFNYTSKNFTPKTVALDGMDYVFSVDLSKMSIPYTELENNNNISDEVKIKLNKKIKEQEKFELTAEDFTIESLFLDLEHADYVNYSDKSTFPASMDPKEIVRITEFQKLLGIYFKTSQEQGNPYVLGYSISLPDLEKRGTAIFQPLSLDFSSSYSEKKGQSALNYLMMIEKMDDDTKEDNRLGKLNSLIDDNMGSEMDGTLGIDFNIFYTNYIEDINTIILKELNEISEKLKKSGGSSSGSGFSFTKEDGSIAVNGTLQLTRDDKTVKYGSEIINANTVRWNTSVTSGERFKVFDYHKIITLNPVVVMTVENGSLILTLQLNMDIEYTTYDNSFSGKTKHANTTNYNHSDACPEGLKMTLTPGIEGKIDVDIVSVKNSEVFLSGEEKSVKKVNDTLTNKTFFNELTDKTFLTNLQSYIKDGILSLPDIVLPISNVYGYGAIAFKDNDTITFQSSYMAGSISKTK